MTICLVTDRRRRPPVEQAAEAAAAGVDIIHIRERDLDAAELSALVRDITAVVRASPGSSTKVVVNDRVDVAVACGADGVHLRGDSMPAVRVRRMTPDGFLIGRSVHSAEEASAAAAGADYLVAGTVFPTPSKPGHAAVLGLPGLSAIAHAVSLPVLAIGGMSVERSSEVAGAGARGLSAIGLFADPDRPIKEVVRLLRERFNIGGKKVPRP
jgi:thiamine-phosphate pyrophosphorylase